MIIPPAEIRVIAEKLAAYAVKNGAGFEEKIFEKERQNPRFSFLYPTDSYHTYYEARLEEYRQAGPGLLVCSLFVSMGECLNFLLIFIFHTAC